MILLWILSVFSTVLMAVGLTGLARITLKGEEEQRSMQLLVFITTFMLGLVLTIVLFGWSIRYHYVTVTTTLLGL